MITFYCLFHYSIYTWKKGLFPFLCVELSHTLSLLRMQDQMTRFFVLTVDCIEGSFLHVWHTDGAFK